jgi:3-hydroxybutyryl-CoA dehydrogenase
MAEILIIGEPELERDLRGTFTEHTISALTLEEMSSLATASMHRNGGNPQQLPPIPAVVFEMFGILDDKMEAVELLHSFIDEDTVIITNVLPSTASETGGWLGHSSQVVGCCFLPTMLRWGTRVELCRTPHTDDDIAERAEAFFRSVGKEVEWVEDRVGLIVPRVLAMIINEAAFAVMEGVASKEDIDRAMRLGTNYPRGPLAWGDEIGLDFIVMVLEALFEEYRDPRYRPCVLLKQMVRAGNVGKREGEGFYEYAP